MVARIERVMKQGAQLSGDVLRLELGEALPRGMQADEEERLLGVEVKLS